MIRGLLATVLVLLCVNAANSVRPLPAGGNKNQRSLKAQQSQRPTTYHMQQYQLALVTEHGRYCSVLVPGSGSIITCSETKLPHVDSFNIQPSMDALDIKTGVTTFKLYYRPHGAFPAIVSPDGLVISKSIGKSSLFALESASHPGVANLVVPFLSDGTDYVYLTVPPARTDSSNASVQNSTRFCRVGDGPASTPVNYNTKKVPGDVLVCDQLSRANATRFRFLPVGWSWNYMRISLTSVKTKKLCSYQWFHVNDTDLTCKTATADEGHAFATPFLRTAKLPMRDGAEFMMQTWIEYPLAMSLWTTDHKHNLVGSPFISNRTNTLAPPRDVPYLSMLKFLNAKPKKATTTTITSGDVVLVRSSRSKFYCQVRGTTAKVVCSATLQQVLKSKDVNSFKFVYTETRPH